MEKTEKIQRNSSFELLRIICMAFIVLGHYAVQGEYVFEDNYLTLNKIILNIISFGGNLANNIFILISGYYLIESKFNFKKILKLIIKMFSYSMLSIIICYGLGIIKFNFVDFAKELMPIIFGPWFVVYYMIIYFMSPFLNKMLKSLKKEQYKILIIFLILIYSIIPNFTKNAWTFSNIDLFIIMYVIGAYLRLHTTVNKVDNKYNIIVSVMMLIMMIMSIIVLTILGYALNSEVIKNNVRYFTVSNSIFTIISSVCIFKYFKNMYFINKKINYIASSTLGVYLIHGDRIFSKVLWTKISPNINYQNSNFLIIHAALKTTIVFIICSIIDKIISGILELTVNKLIDDKAIDLKIEKNIKIILNYISKIRIFN